MSSLGDDAALGGGLAAADVATTAFCESTKHSRERCALFSVCCASLSVVFNATSTNCGVWKLVSVEKWEICMRNAFGAYLTLLEVELSILVER